MNGQVMVLGIAALWIGFAYWGYYQNKRERAKEDAWSLTQIRAVAILKDRISHTKYHVQDAQVARPFGEEFTDRGELRDAGMFDDPVAVAIANSRIPPGFRAVRSCPECQFLATHYIAGSGSLNLYRQCINCEFVWKERI